MTLSDIGKEDEGEQVWHCKPKSWFSLSTHKHGTEFLKKTQLYFLWPKMMFRWGWKAKTHRLKPCFPKFPCACRQTLSKKIYSPASWQTEKVKYDMDTNRLWRSTQPGNKCQLEACLLPATKTVLRCLRRASSSGQWWFLYFLNSG